MPNPKEMEDQILALKCNVETLREIIKFIKKMTEQMQEMATEMENLEVRTTNNLLAFQGKLGGK